MEYLVKLYNEILVSGLKATEEHNIMTIKMRAIKGEETYGDIIFIKRMHDDKYKKDGRGPKTSGSKLGKQKVSRLDSQK